MGEGRWAALRRNAAKRWGEKGRAMKRGREVASVGGELCFSLQRVVVSLNRTLRFLGVLWREVDF